MHDRIINIFFAHTDDGKPLYNIANREIELMNHWLSTNIHITLKLNVWHQVCVSNMGNPEQCVMDQMPIAESNIFVAVFRFSYGRPTGNINPDTGEMYKSGMEEEFHAAYKSFIQNNCPDIIIMKSEEPVPRKYTAYPFADMDTFFTEFRAEGKHPGLYNTFCNEAEFAEVFRRNIMSRLIAILRDIPEENTPSIGKYYQDRGLFDLFLEEHNGIRNQCKTTQIATTKLLRIHARTCYSFISRMGRFHAETRKALENGARFQIIMQNPWSLNSIYAARSDPQFRKKFADFRQHKITASDLLAAFEHNHWYTERFLSCKTGYQSLKKDFSRQIQLRFSEMDLANSILLTDNEIYFEPYFNSIGVGTRNIPLYEIRATSASTLYQDAVTDFEDLWETSCSFTKFLNNETFYREKLCNYLEYTVRR